MQWETVSTPPTPALVTALQYQAGLTGGYYGGKSIEDNVKLAKAAQE